MCGLLDEVLVLRVQTDLWLLDEVLEVRMQTDLQFVLY